MKFQMSELVNASVFTARLGAGSGAANYLVDTKERGKFVKFGGESRYVLAAAGDEIEGYIVQVDTAPSDAFSTGGVSDCVGPNKFKRVTFDGLQATPGTGVVAIGAYVVVGTVVAKDTALTEPARVTQATNQATAKATPFAWRVVSLGSIGTGAVGTTGLIQRVGA